MGTLNREEGGATDKLSSMCLWSVAGLNAGFSNQHIVHSWDRNSWFPRMLERVAVTRCTFHHSCASL